MGWLDIFFGKKEEEQGGEDNQTTVLPDQIPKNQCPYCQTIIQPHEKRKSFNGKKFHIKCFRKAKKAALKAYNSGANMEAEI